MRKTKPQAKMINKVVVLRQTHMHVLIFAVTDHKTKNIPEMSLSWFCHWRCLQKGYKSLPAILDF